MLPWRCRPCIPRADGRVPLLAPSEERELCRHLEVGHASLAAALLAESSSRAVVAE